MKIVMISTDARIFEDGSDVQERMITYGALVDELHIIVYAAGYQKRTLAKNIYLYPTSRRSSIAHIWSGYRLGKEIVYGSGRWVITTQDPFETGIVGCLLRRQPRTAFQAQIHTDFLTPNFSKESFKNKLRALFGCFVIGRADGIRVVSKRIQDSIISRYPNLASRITTLPIFVDAEAIKRSPIRTDLHKQYLGYTHILLMASRITKEKNIPLALYAMKQVLEKYPRALLVIVGDGSELAKIQRITKSLQIEKSVVFESWTDDLPSLYKTADMLLITSNYEGYGRTSIEACAAGLPVVSTDVGIAHELSDTDPQGIRIASNSPSAFARVIDDVLQEKKRGKGLAHIITKEIYEKAMRTSWDISRREKLCYVLPEYSLKSHTHFAYLTDFIERASRDFDIFLIIERGSYPKKAFGCSEIYVAASWFPPLRLLRVKLALARARLQGCKRFYVHYSFFSAFIASVIIRLTGGRVWYWNCGEPWKYKRNIFREGFERMTYKLISYLVTGTDGLGKQYSRQYGIPQRKITVMPNWIDIKTKRENQTEELHDILHISPTTKILLFVHRLSKRKGADILPELMDKLRNEDVVLLIAGDGPERVLLEERFKELGLQENVRFLGWVPQHNIERYFSIADVFVMPSEEEGFPHTLLESMTSGTLFVAGNVGGVRDIVPKEMYTYLIQPGDILGYVRAIKSLLNEEKAKRDEMHRQLKRWVERYDIDIAVNRFKELIQAS